MFALTLYAFVVQVKAGNEGASNRHGDLRQLDPKLSGETPLDDNSTHGELALGGLKAVTG